MKEYWDIAVVLGACRNNIFEEVHREHLPFGSLEKRLGASDTFDWLHSAFRGYAANDIVYVSAHPGINAKGVPWGGFNANERFYKVCDVWLSAWDWSVGASLPEEVAKVAVDRSNLHIKTQIKTGADQEKKPESETVKTLVS